MLTPGVITAIQTFGDRINLHPYLYFLVTEGRVDEAGVFHKIPRTDDLRLAKMFAREVLAMLVRMELLSPGRAERVGKYMIRPVFSLERLSFLEQEDKVGYQRGRDTADQGTMDYLESIAQRTSSWPPRGFLDIAARPAVVFRHDQEGIFIARSGHSSRREKWKTL